MSDQEDPEIIRARGEARARELEARSKLHPTSQFLCTLGEQLAHMGSNLMWGVFLIALLLIFFGPSLIQMYKSL